MAYNGFGLVLGRGGSYDKPTSTNLATHTYTSAEDDFATITAANYFPDFLGADENTVIIGDLFVIQDSSKNSITYLITFPAPLTISADPSENPFNQSLNTTDTPTFSNIHLSSLSTGVAHSDSGGVISSSLIVNADVSSSAAIADTKLATISTGGKVANSATTATSANTVSSIVTRDGSGNFSAGTITATGLVDSALSTGIMHSDSGGAVTSSLIVNADVDAAAGIVDTKLATLSTAGKVSNSATTAVSTNTASAIVARDGSGNFSAGTITASLTGAASLNVLKAGDTMTGTLILNADGVNPLDAVTVQQLNAVAAGFSIKEAAVVATTANLTAIYVNGIAGVGATLTNSGTQVALAIDGVTLSVNDRILVKDQTTQAENGIYTVTNVGSGATNWIITRATDYDQSSEIAPGNLVVVNSGTVNASSSYLETLVVTTIGTDPISFTLFTANPNSFLMKTNNLSDLSNATTSRTNLGLIAGTATLSVGGLTATSVTDSGLSTGVVHSNGSGLFSSSTIVNADVDASAGIVDTKLATISTASKVSNSATTATSANTASAIVARDGSGNFTAGTITANLTGTVTGASSLNVLKAGDTMTGALTINPATNQLVLGGTGGGNTVTVTAPAPAASRTYTMPDSGAAASFVMTEGAQTINGNKTISGTTNLSGLTATRVLTLDGSKNVQASVYGSTNTPFTFVTRDGSGDFATNHITCDNITDTACLTGVVHSDLNGLFSSSLVINDDVAPTAAIVDTKLATISTAGKVSNSATTATSVNTASAIVARDGSGNFNAGTINLSSLTASQAVVTDSSKNLASLAYTNANTASALVQRDGSGNFTAGTITAALTGAASSNVLKAGDTMTGALTINPATNQLVLGGVSGGTTTTINCTAPGANRAYQIPDMQANGFVVLTTNATPIVQTGTFTPTIGDGTHNFVLTTAKGYYSIICDTIFFTVSMVWNSLNSASGDIRFSLPFGMLSDSTNYRGAFTLQFVSGVSWTSGYWLALGGLGGNSYVTLSQSPNNGGAPTNLTNTAFATSGSIIISGAYRNA